MYFKKNLIKYPKYIAVLPPTYPFTEPSSIIKAFNKLRLNKNFIVITDTLQRGLKAQMKEANKINATYAIIIGDDEITANQLTIKNMDTGNQETVNTDKVESYFNSKN